MSFCCRSMPQSFRSIGILTMRSIGGTAAPRTLFYAPTILRQYSDKSAGKCVVQATEVSTEKANELVSQGLTYLDVRTSEEYKSGHCPGAVNVPIKFAAAGGMSDNPDFLKQVEATFPDKSQPLVVGCQAGKRSQMAVEMLDKAGYSDVHNFTGGFAAWSGAGLPVES